MTEPKPPTHPYPLDYAPGKTLLELAARCEAATGPDRDLDLFIMMVIEDIPSVCGGRLQREDNQPPFTASLDAAMTLVPEGLVWSLNTFGNPPKANGYVMSESGEQWRCTGYPATPALALCAAALRAKA